MNRYVVEEHTEYVPETNQYTTTTVVRQLPKRSTALILCIFFGVLGIHRMYVGRVKSGLLMLITGGFFWVGWVVDICLILFGEFKDKDGRIVK